MAKRVEPLTQLNCFQDFQELRLKEVVVPVVPVETLPLFIGSPLWHFPTATDARAIARASKGKSSVSTAQKGWPRSARMAHWIPSVTKSRLPRKRRIPRYAPRAVEAPDGVILGSWLSVSLCVCPSG